MRRKGGRIDGSVRIAARRHRKSGFLRRKPLELYISEIERAGSPPASCPMQSIGDQEYTEDISLTYRFL